MAHTPGPWQYDASVGVVYGAKRYGSLSDTEVGAEFQGCAANDLYEVCTITSHFVTAFRKGGVDYPARPDVVEKMLARDRDNTRLIVAAPELLQALKAIAKQYEMRVPAIMSGEAQWGCLINAKRAIAKAEGGE